MIEYRCRKCCYHFCSENGMPYCTSCGCESLEELFEDCIIEEVVELESHHIHPKFMDNKEGKGQQFNIDKKKHEILHGKIMNWLWEEVEDKEKVISNIINKSKKFLGV